MRADRSNALSDDIVIERHGHRLLAWNPALLAQAPSHESFEPYYWRQRGALLAEAEGRGAAYFIQPDESQTWVLRHYRRGGLLARINRDRYLWTGALATRAAREARLLATLYNRGLPVPRPVAARAVRQAGLVYSADLITLALPGTEPLAERLMRAPLVATGWQAIGKVIAEMHRAGVWHADLNARNILTADDETFYLIDFDKARFRGDGKWRRANLARLRRSFDKFSANQRDFYFAESDWIALTGGYQSAFAVFGRL